MNKLELFTFLKNKGREANKSLGQHFLINPNISKQIVEALEIKKSDKILEIGAGFAALSYFLVQKSPHITLLDVDEEAIKFLNDLFKQNTNVLITKENILKHDIVSYDLIVGNIPYYLTKQILQYVLLNANKARRVMLMLQKEVYEKLLTKTSDKDFNPLAILVSYLGSAKKVMNVPRNNFSPPPKVDSVIIQIDLVNNIEKEYRVNFYNFLNGLFMHKRKTIHNNFSRLINNTKQSEETLQHLHIDINKRPHELTLEEFLMLFNYFKPKNS